MRYFTFHISLCQIRYCLGARSPPFSSQHTYSLCIFKGASPGELLIEAARRNNTDLLKEVIDGCGSAEKAAVLLNETKTVLGNYIYHEAALNGNCAYIMTTFPSLLLEHFS
jgi:hypothetical protein